MATSNLICGWGWPFRPATPTSRPNPTRSVHPISTTSADANPVLALQFLDALFRQGVLLAIPIVLAMLLSDVALMLVARFAPQLRVEDASAAARNLVFCFVLPLYCAILLAAMGREMLIPPGFLVGLQRGFQ